MVSLDCALKFHPVSSVIGILIQNVFKCASYIFCISAFLFFFVLCICRNMNISETFVYQYLLMVNFDFTLHIMFLLYFGFHFITVSHKIYVWMWILYNEYWNMVSSGFTLNVIVNLHFVPLSYFVSNKI